MTKIKSGLLTSIVALVLCVAMLVGTTFAWFTDSVTSANNVIQSGTLDIVLEYWDGDSWEDVAGKSDILTNTLWEPGVAEVAYLRVANAGSLALKYQLGVNIVSETAGVNMAGESFLLSDYLQFGVVEGVNGETGAYADRDAAVAAVSDAKALNAGYTKPGSLAANTAPVYLALVVYMPTTVDNVANHNGTDVPTINLGINVLATQVANEEDSFGPDYDEDAVYGDAFVADAADLANAIANAENGDVIVLMDDIDLTSRTRAVSPFALEIANGKSLTINLNGNTISGTSASDSGNQGLFRVKGDLAIEGEGSLVIEHTGANMGWGALSAVFSVEGGSLTLGEGVVASHKGGTDMAYVVDVNSTLGETVLNVNGAILDSTYVGVRLFNNHNTAKAIVNVNSGVIDGPRRDIWKQYDKPAEINIADGIAYTNENEYEYFFGTAVVDSSADLSSAISGNDEIILLGGEYTLPSSDLNAGQTLICSPDTVFTGTSSLNINGATVIGATFSNPTGSAASQTINGTFKNCVFTGSNGLRWCYSGDTVVFEDCVFDGDVYGVHFDGGAKEVIFKNCTISGFNATAESIEKVTFDGCTFKANGKSNYNGINSWGSTDYIDCTFVFDGTAGNEWVHLRGEGKTMTFTNCVVEGNGQLTDYIEKTETGVVIIDGKKFVVAETLSEVMAAAKDGNVIIDAKGANLGDFYYNGTFGNGTVLKNATFTYVYGASVDGVATFENCNFVSDHSYSANFSDGSYTGKVIFNNCHFDGWSSFGDAITGVEMNNCTFDWNNPYSMLRFYQNAVLNNCDFIAIEGIDTNKTGTVVEFNNCTGIEGKIYNNGSCVGTWIVDGTDISSTVTSW